VFGKAQFSVRVRGSIRTAAPGWIHAAGVHGRQPDGHQSHADQDRGKTKGPTPSPCTGSQRSTESTRKPRARPTTAPRRQPQPLNDHHAPQAAIPLPTRAGYRFPETAEGPRDSRPKFDGDCTKKQCPRDRVPGRLGSRTASLRPQPARPVCGVSNTACELLSEWYCSLPRKAEHEEIPDCTVGDVRHGRFRPLWQWRSR